MKGVLRHPFRFAFQSLCLGAGLLLSFIDFAWTILFRGNRPVNVVRCLALHRAARRCLRSIGGSIVVEGPPPARGLLVSNHLSYVDILVLGSITPAIFVAKSEVQRWPVFGWFAKQSGCLFIERNRRSDVARINQLVASRLQENLLLVIFPEGTSSDGSDVLPFKSSLLEPIVGLDHPLSVAHISYTLAEGDPGQDICYWGEMTFATHLLKLLSRRRPVATVRFAPIDARPDCRKELARHLHGAVRGLKSSAPPHGARTFAVNT